MRRSVLGIVAVLFALSGCAGTAPTRMGPDGKPLPQVYRLSRAGSSKVQYRMLDGINALREARGLAPVELDPRLNGAAFDHSRDMASQHRAWDWGSDGSSPYDRVARAGFQGALGSELVSQTFETELDTLAAWMEDPAARDAILDPNATDIGFGFYQESSGLIWWTLLTGRSAAVMAGL